MKSFLFEIIKIRISEYQQGLARSLIGPMLGVLSAIMLRIGLNRIGAKYAMQSHRWSYSPTAIAAIWRLSRQHNKYKGVIASLVSKGDELSKVAQRMLVIKWPTIYDGRVGSKGIIIITFTPSFPFFFKYVDISKLEEYFYIVLEPSWSGYLDADILEWRNITTNPVFVQASEIYDRSTLDSLNGTLTPISIGASDWVDHETFSPANVERSIDSIYVANTTREKRIHRYLAAISNIVRSGNRDYRGALVCSTWGGRVKVISNMVEYYCLRENCDLLFSLDKNQLCEMLRKSKTNILLSKKEGSNRSLFEAMFCNTPVLALIDNFGVNKSYINEFTGKLIWDQNLESALLSMKESWFRFKPREWAMNNISTMVTTNKLCQAIICKTNDTPFMEDVKINGSILLKVNRPEIEYLNFPKFDKGTFNSEFLCKFSKDKQALNMVLEMNRLKDIFYYEYIAKSGLVAS